MKAYLGLGSNLGNKELYLHDAIKLLRERVKIDSQSYFYATKPWGTEWQPDFLNATIGIETELNPFELLDFTQSIETKLHRVRPEDHIKDIEDQLTKLSPAERGIKFTPIDGTNLHKAELSKKIYAPRTIDIDILFYGNTIIDSEHLKVPHPLIEQRAFVLNPLSEIAPDFVHPGLSKTVEDLRLKLAGSEHALRPFPGRLYADALYDVHNSSGALRIQNAIPKKWLEYLGSICTYLDRNGFLKKSKEYEGGVRQESYTRYVGTAPGETEEINSDELSAIKSLAKEYTQQYYNKIAAVKSFEPVQGHVSSIGIHKYPANNGGIDFHLDYAKDRNIVGVFSVLGKGKFTVARTREGTWSSSWITNPGDLILMRHNRNAEELHLRPFHKIETLGEDRYSIIFRQRG
jgi:2-amino-4-hydroxy-6-hydroxymethyldihydropteridine diphosphokinase